MAARSCMHYGQGSGSTEGVQGCQREAAASALEAGAHQDGLCSQFA